MEGCVGGLGAGIGHLDTRAFAVRIEAEEKTERLGKVHGVVGGNEAGLLGVVLDPCKLKVVRGDRTDNAIWSNFHK